MLSLLLIFVGAKLLSEIFERLRQPGIAGEIIAGLLLGPHVLGWIEHSPTIGLLGQAGVILLLFRVGLEVKASELRSIGGRATLIALLIVAITLPSQKRPKAPRPWVVITTIGRSSDSTCCSRASAGRPRTTLVVTSIPASKRAACACRYCSAAVASSASSSKPRLRRRIPWRASRRKTL